MEEAKNIGQLRFQFHLRKTQLERVLDKAAKLTNVLVNYTYNIVVYFFYMESVDHDPDELINAIDLRVKVCEPWSTWTCLVCTFGKSIVD